MDSLRWALAGEKGQKKRVWSDEEKRSIYAQAGVSGVSVAQVARRHAMNTNLIHKWLRDPRFSSVDQALDLPEPDHATFLPIEVAGMTPAQMAPISRAPSTSSVTAQRIDTILCDGRRILVQGPTALSAIVTMVEAVAQ